MGRATDALVPLELVSPLRMGRNASPRTQREGSPESQERHILDHVHHALIFDRRAAKYNQKFESKIRESDSRLAEV